MDSFQLTKSLAYINLSVSIRLLRGLIVNGLSSLVLCPGSRSGPLAIAAGGLADQGHLKLFTSIDERSAAFMALGMGTARGLASAVVTTSGTAVAELLPAAVEADRSCQPLIFISADRPKRLKNCGANQTVNQEEFLKSVCRHVEYSLEDGFHQASDELIHEKTNLVWRKAHEFPGPVHWNLPFEEPLHPSLQEQEIVWAGFKSSNFVSDRNPAKDLKNKKIVTYSQYNFWIKSRPGVIIVGPWRGLASNLQSFNEALAKWQALSGWPVFADPLSGIEDNQSGLIKNWELILKTAFEKLEIEINVLRLGPMPSSKVLENWLSLIGKNQLLITEGELRSLDPLKVSKQFSGGLTNWVSSIAPQIKNLETITPIDSLKFLSFLEDLDSKISHWLDRELEKEKAITEPGLSRVLPKLLPNNFSIMLSASSPIRDWISFSGLAGLKKRCFGFRGASGIDGTLSLAMGLAQIQGPLCLITGDLSLMHDSNGWLFANVNTPPLIVFLIDNYGGGIFHQFDLATNFKEGIEKLFSMPQQVDTLMMATSMNIPNRQISCLDDLETSFQWAISLKKPVLLRVSTNSKADSLLRKKICKELKKYLHAISQNK